MGIGNESTWNGKKMETEKGIKEILFFFSSCGCMRSVLSFFFLFYVHNFISIKLGAISIELLPAEAPTEAADEDGRDRTQR